MPMSDPMSALRDDLDETWLLLEEANATITDLTAQLAAARQRVAEVEGALVEIRAEMPATCACDPAYSGRHLADPSCGYHDYGAVCLEIIDHALAARGEWWT